MPSLRITHIVSLVGLLSLCALLYSSIAVAGSDTFRTTPTTNYGKKWRIGYYEGGPYVNYPANLKTIALGLIKLGWLADMRFSDAADDTDSKVVWVALSKAKSDYLQFVLHAYSSANWDKKLRARNRKTAIDSLQNRQLDFMIAMGTWAGQDLANKLHSIPTMVVSTSDPVKSGIIKSVKESGFAHVHAKCDPERYIQQIRLFHDIIGFKRLGIVYENSVVGKTYAALTDIEYVAARRGFQLVRI